MAESEKLVKARELWGKYFMVTNELLKFIDKQDIDNFIELIDQRQKLIELLNELPDTEYRKTEECQALFAKIKPIDMQLLYKSKSWLNKAKRNTMAVKSYDLTGANPLGNMLNRQF